MMESVICPLPSWCQKSIKLGLLSSSLKYILGYSCHQPVTEQLELTVPDTEDVQDTSLESMFLSLITPWLLPLPSPTIHLDNVFLCLPRLSLPLCLEDKAHPQYSNPFISDLPQDKVDICLSVHMYQMNNKDNNCVVYWTWRIFLFFFKHVSCYSLIEPTQQILWVEFKVICILHPRKSRHSQASQFN